jgi:hypothetical protein
MVECGIGIVVVSSSRSLLMSSYVHCPGETTSTVASHTIAESGTILDLMRTVMRDVVGVMNCVEVCTQSVEGTVDPANMFSKYVAFCDHSTSNMALHDAPVHTYLN